MQHTHSVSAGLDYIGVSPILAHWHESGRMRAESATDVEVIDALKMLMRTEGIIGALESCHGLAGGLREAATMDPEQTVLINMSGRGDKDIFTIADALDDEKWKEFLRQKVEKL